MIDYTKVKVGDRFRVTKAMAPTDDIGKEITVASITLGDFGFYATDGLGYAWSQVEPITEPALITRPIEGMPEWLANTPKGVAVKCRVKDGGMWGPAPKWIIGSTSGGMFVDEEGAWFYDAEPWTEPEAKPSLFTPEQLAELDARYGRKDA